MKSMNMNARQIKILEKLRNAASPNDADLITKTIDGSLEEHNVQRLCELINDEYLMSGIHPDYSPNDYGVELEELLNAINYGRITKQS